jgi:hypothetical protein
LGFGLNFNPTNQSYLTTKISKDLKPKKQIQNEQIDATKMYNQGNLQENSE